jgi:hypothetical protein
MDSPIRRSRRLAGLPPPEFSKIQDAPHEAVLDLEPHPPRYYSPRAVQACQEAVVLVVGVLTTLPLLKALF